MDDDKMTGDEGLQDPPIVNRPPIEIIAIKMADCLDQDDPWCTIPYNKDGLCLACKDRILMDKCPRGEKLENLTITHHFQCPTCGADI